jgi:hypothetical protein
VKVFMKDRFKGDFYLKNSDLVFNRYITFPIVAVISLALLLGGHANGLYVLIYQYIPGVKVLAEGAACENAARSVWSFFWVFMPLLSGLVVIAAYRVRVVVRFSAWRLFFATLFMGVLCLAMFHFLFYGSDGLGDGRISTLYKGGCAGFVLVSGSAWFGFYCSLYGCVKGVLELLKNVLS